MSLLRRQRECKKKRQYWFDKQNNNFARDNVFLYISLPSLHEYDVNSPIFTFDGGRSLPAAGKENVKNYNRLCVYKTITRFFVQVCCHCSRATSPDSKLQLPKFGHA